MKKRISLILVLLMLLCAFGAPAESQADPWFCPSCGQRSNTGNFCSNCGAARPRTDWDCPSCGQEGNTGNFCTNCGAARPDAQDPQTDQQTVNEHLEQIPGETDKVKVLLKDAEASSFIVNKKNPDLWIPANAVDNNETTCWQFSAKKGLDGKSWLTLTLAAPEAVDEIWFKNGFQAYNEKGIGQYDINARPKDVRVEFLFSAQIGFSMATEFRLKDEAYNGWQMIPLDHLENVEAVRISILTVYKGSQFPNDVCLSDVMLVQHAPADIALPPQEFTETVVYTSNPAVTGASLLMKLATRSGPGTQYDEPGTFFGKTWKETTVKVLGKSYDGSVWWVLVDFSNSGKASYRVWTGLKRVDVDLSKVKEINPIGQGTVDATSKTYRGPGGAYAKAKVTITDWVDVLAYSRENGYVEVEFEQNGKWYRVWVPEKVAHIDWGTDNSGNR